MTPARGDVVVDGVYRALPDEVSDRLLGLVTALAAEVWTTRDRLRLVESALARAGVALDVDAVRDTAEQIAAMQADRDAFVARCSRQPPRPAPPPGDAALGAPVRCR